MPTTYRDAYAFLADYGLLPVVVDSHGMAYSFKYDGGHGTHVDIRTAMKWYPETLLANRVSEFESVSYEDEQKVSEK